MTRFQGLQQRASGPANRFVATTTILQISGAGTLPGAGLTRLYFSIISIEKTGHFRELVALQYTDGAKPRWPSLKSASSDWRK